MTIVLFEKGFMVVWLEKRKGAFTPFLGLVRKGLMA
jgi:hypothetical protein